MQQDDSGANALADEQYETCIECGKRFPAREMLQFGEYRVCAECKPVFQQKLAEGSFRPALLDFASIGRRFAAVFLDGMIIWFAYFIVGLIAFEIMGKGGIAQGLTNLGGVLGPTLSLVFTATYMIGFTGKYGATPGKMALGVKIVRADGGAIGVPLAVGRYFSTFISSMTIGIGYLMAFFDKEKRTLHDRICGTRVIRA